MSSGEAAGKMAVAEVDYARAQVKQREGGPAEQPGRPETYHHPVTGGLIGAATGLFGSVAIATLGESWPGVVRIESVVLAFSFSAAVGLFFGFYPARKAARLDPIEALR